MKALGLAFDTDYSTPEGIKRLRYGRVIFFTDQDPDGDHICGVLMASLYAMFPTLIGSNIFFRMITPIVKASKGREKRNFYSIGEKDRWWESLSAEQRRGWTLKYYKGLGTSSNEEGREYFRDLANLCKQLNADENHAESLTLAFGKDASKRKPWLLDTPIGANGVDPAEEQWDISAFVNGPVRDFSLYSIERALPSAVDGLIPSRRKAIMAAMRHAGSKKEIKVPELTGQVMSEFAYHHGDASMNSVIINLAQGYTGRLNWRLFRQSGQFGSRVGPPGEHAAPRYLSTLPEDILCTLFTKDDVAISRQQQDDGKTIEPYEMQCTFPLILVNGVTQALATGFSSYVPPHNPRDVARAIVAIAAGQEPPELTPWFRGFKGEIEPAGKGVFTARGIWERSGDSVHVTELPPGTWTQKFIDALTNKEAKPGSKRKREGAVVRGVTWAAQMDVNDVDITLQLVPGTDDDTLRAALIAAGMEVSISYNNMNLLVPEGERAWRLRTFETPIEMLRYWTEQRVEAIGRRKQHMLEGLRAKARNAHIRSVFCDAVRTGQLQLYRRNASGAIEDDSDEQLHARIRAVIPDATEDELRTLEGLNWCSYVKAKEAERLRKTTREAEEQADRLEATPVQEIMRQDILAVKACIDS